jgi:hypothetical protein
MLLFYDIDIYRELAGGVTTRSYYMVRQINWRTICNCKMEWSASPEEMLYKNQPKFIKFALGENVKQSSLSNSNPTRFPSNRRMVEQVLPIIFNELKNTMIGKPTVLIQKKKSIRVDLELQTLAEIINKRKIYYLPFLCSIRNFNDDASC